MSEPYDNDWHTQYRPPFCKPGESHKEACERHDREAQEAREAHARKTQEHRAEYERKYGKLNIPSDPPPWTR